MCFCLGFYCTVLADYPMEIIEIRSRPVEDILPVVRDFLGDSGTATGMGSTLVLKAPPGQVREIRRLLAEIDQPPKRLLITVSNAGDASASSSGYIASGDINSGDGNISINSPGRSVERSRARISLHGRSGQYGRSSRQQVQAVEGRPAYINAGGVVSVRQRPRHYIDGVPHERGAIGLQDVSSGFYVIPRVSGEYVTLEISRHHDRPGRVPGTYDTQRAGTVIRSRLGEWVGLGGIDSAGQESRDGLARSHSERAAGSRQVRVKVECLDCAK